MKTERKMKKQVTCILAAALVFAAGCAKNTTTTMDTAAVADKLISSIQFSDQMSAIEDKTALKLYGLENDAVTKMKVYESTGATAEEVAAFEAKDDTSAAAVKEAAQKRIDDQKSGFEGYQPKEMAKLKAPVLVTKGKYVILCVSDDNSTAQKVIDGFIK